MPEFLSQAFVEGERPHRCAGVIHVLRTRDEASHASNSHNMAMVSFDHRWYKLLDEKKMGNEVDIEDSANLLFTFVKDSTHLHNARVVDQNCRITMLRSDLPCHRFKARGGCDLHLVEVCICSCKRAFRRMWS